MNIPYIISGKETYDLNAVLIKLKKNFNINTLALCGGAIITGAFLRAHLVDEISLVLAPQVNGNSSKKAAFDTLGEFIDDGFEFYSAKKISRWRSSFNFYKG